MRIMSDEICELEVKNYKDFLLLELHNLQKEDCLCDLSLVAKDGTIKVHEAVLVAASSYFKQRTNMELSLRDRIHFPNVSLSVLQCVVQYIYTGTLNVNINIFKSVLELCKELKLDKAVEVCDSFQKVKHELQEEDDTIEEQEADTQTLAVLDQYSDSTDIESVVETPPILKATKSRKRSYSALKLKGNSKDSNMDKNDKTKRYPTDSLTVELKPLKVPKLSLSLNRKIKDEEESIGKKRKKLKSLNSEVKRKRRRKSGAAGNINIRKKKQSDKREKNPDIIKTSAQAEGDSSIEATTKDLSMETSKSDKMKTDISKEVEDMTLSEMEDLDVPKQCRICKDTFENMKSFFKHVRTHDLNPGGRRKCKQEVWPCCVCGRKLTTAVRQACHHYSKHGIPYDEKLKLHACDVEGCKYVTASSHYLQIHKKGRHGNERPHVCEFCGKGFKLPSALVTHLNIHTNSKIYKCEECDLTFNQKGGLDIHVKKHHKGEASWTELCHLCSEKFLQKAELSWHMYVVHQIPLPDRYKVYSCDLCDYQTIRKNKLERHQDAHNDTRSWSCEICGKKFVTKSYLNRHLRYHGEKSFKCTFDGCNYACVDNIGLKKHIRLMHTHKNYKPFMCSLCQYKTGLRGNLDKHIRTVHNLDVVTKHTVHLKMKFKNRHSGDILTKDGEYINTVVDHRGEDPLRLQAMLDSEEEEDIEEKPVDMIMKAGIIYIIQAMLDSEEEDDESENKPVDMIMKAGIVYSASNGGRKQTEEETSSQISSSEDSSQQVAVRSSQSSALPYVYNSMQYLSSVSQIPYTMVHLPTQMQHGEMYPNIDPITLSAAYMD